jgi:transporter family protein
MNVSALSSWQVWAALSALFAALTAIFAKVGVENINSDLATFIRTIVVVCILTLIVYATRQFQNPATISARSYLFLLLSGLGTGASWLCYFRALKLGSAAQVAPIDKLSVVLVATFGVVFLGRAAVGTELARYPVGYGRRATGRLVTAGFGTALTGV